MRHRCRLVWLIPFVACTLALAATPPALVNYQGVLRSATDVPLSGTYDMTFRLYSAAVGGDEILVDAHTASAGVAINVSGGLFNAALGSGVVTDGAGPGTYATLADVFRIYGTVYLSVQVGSETLSPRTQILASAYALNSSTLGGRPASEFIDTSATTQTKSGTLSLDAPGVNSDGLYCHGGSYGAYFTGGDVGIDSRGVRAAGQFFELTGNSQATIAGDSTGIGAFGGYAGGVFSNLDYTGEARLALSTVGVQARGTVAGGNFYSWSGTGSALLGSGDYGIKAYGTYPNGMAGYFKDAVYTGEVWLGDGDTGVISYGSFAGGTFRHGTPASYDSEAFTGSTHYGIFASGTLDNGGAGALLFDRIYSGEAYIGHGNTGVDSYGTFAGGIFRQGDPTSYTSEAYLAHNNLGVEGYGTTSGGYFYNKTSGAADYVAYYGGGVNYKIAGSGTVAFIQNHPEVPDDQIVYAAPEGDEVAVYTRGSSRLLDGRAVVALGATFRWVVNPDIGLTAQVTPRGKAVPLAVESVNANELVVIGPPGAVVDFDYTVWGLRIGFERMAVVQKKTMNGTVPTVGDAATYYREHPELERFSALSRHKTEAGRDDVAIDLSRSDALVQKINSQPWVEPEGAKADPARSTATGMTARPSPGWTDEAIRPVASAAPAVPNAGSARSTLVALAVIAVSERVEQGDVVTNDPASPGRAIRARAQADRGVLGIVGGDPSASYRDEAPLALAGTIVYCKVDAAYTPIEANDLLVASPTAGHAMRAGENPAQGTVIGKALEPLTGGTGTIRVLVMSR